MTTLLDTLCSFCKDYIPKSFTCLKERHTKEYFFNDLFAGISVGVIALPLALAFAIGSGVTPERGLFTAIVAGFLISLLGGSRVQIGGPTGAFVVIVYTVIQKHGYDGMALATILAGIMMVAMGLARFGVLLKFIPYPVTTGFTTGIAVVIFIQQIKDFLGLHVTSMPPGFVEKCLIYCEYAHTWNPYAFGIATGTLGLLFLLRYTLPKIPGAIIVVVLATAITYFLELPIETIESRFGGIPRMLPEPSLPSFSLEMVQQVFPDAITIALLGAIESLLSAVVADGMTGHRHRSNCELLAQGIANIGSILFGGIPATGAIARTTANIKLGAKTPLAGMIHAATLLLLMLVFAPVASKIPLSALSGILIYVAWNMSELPHFIDILKNHGIEAIVLLITFLLTVLIDLAVAVQVGVILAAVVFLKRMTDTTTINSCNLLVEESEPEAPSPDDSEIIFRSDIPSDVVVFEINGPFFYSVADLLDEALIQLSIQPRVFILRLHKMAMIDTTGIRAIKQFGIKCQQKNINLLICEASSKVEAIFKKTGVLKTIGADHLTLTFNEALKKAE